MKISLLFLFFTLLLQCKNSSTVNNTNEIPADDTSTETEIAENTHWWRDTTSEAAVAKAGEFEIEKYRTVWIDYDRFFNLLVPAPKQEEASDDNRVKVALPLPHGDTEEFAMHQVQVMAPELAEKYPQIRTYEGRSTSDPTTSIRLDFGDNGANYMIIKLGEQIYLQPVTRGKTDIYIIYNKKDVKKFPVDFENPGK